LKILPPETRPPAKPTLRRHRPNPSRRWTEYRPCLRWDFGFTCAFCLLHEADIYGGQIGEGLGGTTVEHRIARSVDVGRKNDYDNCLYACRFCNRSRSAKALLQRGGRLLDPTRDSWSRHFLAAHDRLLPSEGDAAASYTHQTYDLDDPRKTARRRARRELLSDRLLLLKRLEDESAKLLQLADFLRRQDLQRFGRFLQQLKSIRTDARRALGDLTRYAAIPADAPRFCRCRTSGNESLPVELDRQMIEVPDAVLAKPPAPGGQYT
jgi:5-methylcytosine-specific restriction endonuclease McrA